MNFKGMNIVEFKFIIALSACVLFFSASTSVANSQDVAIVHACHFDISTFVPITTTNVDSECAEKWTIADEVKIARLTKLFRPARKKTFDEVNVRVDVVLDSQHYFIDSNGVVKAGTRLYTVDKNEFGEFRKSLGQTEVNNPQ
jgi:hypothetical protein